MTDTEIALIVAAGGWLVAIFLSVIGFSHAGHGHAASGGVGRRERQHSIRPPLFHSPRHLHAGGCCLSRTQQGNDS